MSAGTVAVLGAGAAGLCAAVPAAAVPEAAMPAAAVPGAADPGAVQPAGRAPADRHAAACASTDLAVALTDLQGGAGQLHALLALTNTGSRECIVTGHPAVFQVDGGGRALGSLAAVDGPAGPPVALPPGDRAEAGLTVTRGGLVPDCADAVPPAVAGLRLMPPGAAAVLPVDGLLAVAYTAELADWFDDGPAGRGSHAAARVCPRPAVVGMRVSAFYPPA